MESDAEESPATACESKRKQKWEQFYSKLQDFPNSFMLERDHRQMGEVQVQKLSKGLQHALHAGYKTALETARAMNYKAFLLTCQGKFIDALALTREAAKEEGEQHNLVSLANGAVILWRMGRHQEAEAEIVKLGSLKINPDVDFDYLQVKARAELAFARSRMGPRFFSKAAEDFEGLVILAREPEKWLWTFGMGLCRRRSLHLMHSPLFREQNTKTESTNAMEAFLGVISHADNTLKAKAYVEMAMLIGRMVWDQQEKERLAKMAGGCPRDLCKKALQLDDNDNSVLCKAARILAQGDEHADNFKDLPFDGPEDLYKRALKIRPSSTAFHHLGLTYKAKAIQAEKERRQDDYTGFGRRLPSDVFKLVKAIKSPMNFIPLSKSDHLVSEAMTCLQEAYTFSEGMNLHALYDVALMHRFVGESEEALRRLEDLRHKNKARSYLTVNAYEQTGLILMTRSKNEEDDIKKAELICEAESMFYRALETAVQLYSKNPDTKGCIGEIWHSFIQLITTVDDSDLPETEKLLKKAELFVKISDTDKSEKLLERLQKLQSSSQPQDPNVLKICIEMHLDMKRFDHALALVEVLMSTPQGKKTVTESFGDEYVLQLRLQVAKEALLSNKLDRSKEIFYGVFLAGQSYQASGEKQTPTAGERQILLTFYDSDPSHRQVADCLGKILICACGLEVEVITEPNNVHGRLVMNSILLPSKRCHQIVVLAGAKDIPEKLKKFLNPAEQPAGSASAIKVLLIDVDTAPASLQFYPSLRCPADLLQFCKEAQQAHSADLHFPYSKTTVDGISAVFQFLVGLTPGH